MQVKSHHHLIKWRQYPNCPICSRENLITNYKETQGAKQVSENINR